MAPIAVNQLVASGVSIPRYLGSIAILFYAAAILIVLVSNVYGISIQTKVPLLGLLLVVAVGWNVFRINDNHAVRLDPPADQNSMEQAGQLPAMKNVFETWVETRQDAIDLASPDRPYPVYVVSAQGGGVYAAFHAAKALGVLTEAIPEFPSHIFAISGVSGGSVGSSLYVNALDGVEANQVPERIDNTFDTDHLSPVLAAMLFGDLTQRFYPLPVATWDRALGLELSFENGGRAGVADGGPAAINMEKPFFASQRDSRWQETKTPYLVLNTTEVKSGLRLLLSPFEFKTDARFHEPVSVKRPQDKNQDIRFSTCLLYTSPSPRDQRGSRMPSSA